jgi:putative spermidine/putrescine transport system substrate-binding protein
MLTRRAFLKRVGAVVAVSALPAPAIAQPVTLRVLGLPATVGFTFLQERARQDLGINIEFIAEDTQRLGFTVTNAPDRFDVVEGFNGRLGKLWWPAGSLQPIPIERIQRWGEIPEPLRTGEITPEAQGSYINELYVQPDGSLGSTPTDFVSNAITIFNADAYGWLPDVEPLPVEGESWANLLDPKFKGQVMLNGDTLVGVRDATLIAEAIGACQFQDKANLTRDEIRCLVDNVLIPAKRQGQFSGFWVSFNASVELVASGTATIGSLWTQGWYILNALGIPVKYATPREGFRAFTIGISISSRVDPQSPVFDAAIDYINWWYEAEAGAAAHILSLFGFYFALWPRLNPANGGPFTENEYGFFYEGKPATDPIPNVLAGAGIGGPTVFPAGFVRPGGSIEERMRRVKVFNAVDDENAFMVQKWNEFQTA